MRQEASRGSEVFGMPWRPRVDRDQESGRKHLGLVAARNVHTVAGPQIERACVVTCHTECLRLAAAPGAAAKTAAGRLVAASSKVQAQGSTDENSGPRALLCIAHGACFTFHRDASNSRRAHQLSRGWKLSGNTVGALVWAAALVGLRMSSARDQYSVSYIDIAYWFAKRPTADANAAIRAPVRTGLICRSAYEACQQNHHHCPKRRRSNTVRGLTSEAQIDPKVLQQSATNERTD